MFPISLDTVFIVGTIITMNLYLASRINHLNDVMHELYFKFADLMSLKKN